MTQTIGADRVIVALDCKTSEENLALITTLGARARWYKVGMRQYYAGGDAVMAAIRDAGAKVFLDLKLHDIPAMVEGAARSLRRWAPELATVHASGGPAMIAAAVEGFGDATDVLAVTVLTSLGIDDMSALWGTDAMRQEAMSSTVVRLGGVAIGAGAAGLVCAPFEAQHLRLKFGSDALLVTPGIRPSGVSTDDQKRVATPADAVRAGASYLVVGRPIHAAADPGAAFEAIRDTPLG